MSFSKNNIFAMIVVAVIFIYFAFFSKKMNIYDSYLGRTFLAILIVLLTYYNPWLGIVAVLAVISIFGMTTTETFVNEWDLFKQQNQLQKKVYYVPKRKEAPIPQNDTDYVPMNPMQSAIGAIQSSQPAKVFSQSQSKMGGMYVKSTGNNYDQVLRVQEMVRPKSSKTMNLPRETGLNIDYDPAPNWPDGHAFENPYSLAQE